MSFVRELLNRTALGKIAVLANGNDAKPDFGLRSGANRDRDQFVTRDVGIAAHLSWLLPNRPHQQRGRNHA